MYRGFCRSRFKLSDTVKNGGVVAHPARSDDAPGPDHMEQAVDNSHLLVIRAGLGMVCTWQVRIWPPQFAIFAHFPTILPYKDRDT
eukprot:SAG11_NODE_1775_length_4269_cov_3.089448_2_plen_86_part_00